MKIIFFGSDDFAGRHLEALLDSPHEVLACVTHPDKAKGRGMRLVGSPVKECAKSKGMEVLQPRSIQDSSFGLNLKKRNCDLFVVIAYGRILPPKLLQIPNIGAVNVHASLLPKYRGAAPINWAILKGEPETGISIIQMNARMDAGDIWAQEKIPVLAEDTAVTLRQRMRENGPAFLLETIAGIEQNKISPIPQDEQAVTLAPKLTKELGRIKWSEGAQEIHNLVRGLLPWPTAYTFFKGKILKLLETKVEGGQNLQGSPGEILNISKEGFTAAAGKGSLLVKKVHFESSKPMDAYSFVIGHGLGVGIKFG